MILRSSLSLFSLLILSYFLLPIYTRPYPNKTRGEAQIVRLTEGIHSPAQEYSLQIKIGNPQKYFNVQLDTQSKQLVVNWDTPKNSSSATIPGCGPIFNCISCKESLCEFTSSFSPRPPNNWIGTVFGTKWNDTIAFGDLEVNSTYGAYFWSNNFQATNLQGILGLKVESSPDSVLHNIFNAKNMDQIVSLCLGDFGGYLVLGGIEEKFYQGNMTFISAYSSDTDMIEYSPYQLEALSLKVGGEVVSKTPLNPTTIDPAQKHLLLDDALFNAFREKLASECQVKSNGVCSLLKLMDGKCVTVIEKDIADFPNVTLELQGIPLELTPSVYLQNGPKGTKCLFISPNRIDGMTILGSVVLQKYYVAFDIEKRRIGFAPSFNCSGAKYILEKVSGDQTGVIKKDASDPLVVKVLYAHDRSPAVNVAVRFIHIQGEATLSRTNATTNKDGIAQIRVTLGKHVETNTILAFLDYAIDAPVRFEVRGQESIIYVILSVAAIVVMLTALVAVLFAHYKIEEAKRRRGRILLDVFH